MAASKTLSTIIAAGTSNAAAATTTGTPVSLATAYGAFITGILTNGATGPTAAAVAIIEASGDGTTWKEVYRVGADTVANSITPFSYEVCAPIMNARVRVNGNTGQAVTCEAFAHVLTSI